MNNYEEILSFLNESGISAGDSYESALLALKKYLHIKADANSKSVKFGDVGLVSTGYALISASQIEQVRKYLKKIKGVKIFVRMFPSAKLKSKEMYALVEPGTVMWELSCKDASVINNAAFEIAQMLQIAVECKSK